MELWGSFVMQGIPALGMLVAGSFRRAGWLICLVGQAFTVMYGILTEQYGFMAWAPVYVAIYGWNWVSWRREEKRKNGSALPALPQTGGRRGGLDQGPP